VDICSDDGLAHGLPGIWQEAIRFAPDPHPRLALAGEQLFESHPSWYLGANPFAWDFEPELTPVDRFGSFADRVKRFAAIAR
jgi:hypothetical protein